MKIGTRKSRLAMVQTEMAAEAIKKVFPSIEIEIAGFETKGDLHLDKSLSAFGSKGAFTKELEGAMMDGRIDLAVHSAKDLPVELPEGLTVGAVLKRGDSRDVWVSLRKEFSEIEACRGKVIVGTGSLRRALQIRQMCNGVEIRDIRGNVPTRLKKLSEELFDGIILAAAGLKRLGYLSDACNETGCFEAEEQTFFYEILSKEQFLPAAGQGIIALETRQKDCEDCMQAIHDEDTWQMFLTERSFLRAIGGGCNEAAAVDVRMDGQKVSVRARYAGDGLHMKEKTVTGTRCGNIEEDRKLAVSLGEQIAARLQSGKVYLIGAGPGDTGLITMKGIEALKEADVVVYDHLASASLLNETKDAAEWIDAGKFAGNHRMKQSEIEQLLIEKAMAGHVVARLKGGDPFIFGRGGEEALALTAAGIDYEVIPGVSSAYSAPAYAGIPITHRGKASSFHVITGHEDPTKENSSLDYEILAREEGTLVFLMGLSKLHQISERLIANGKDAHTPAAVIASGTTARQRCVTGELGRIAAISEKADIQPPAILVVGDVVNLKGAVDWQQPGPLSGRKILVTATEIIARPLAEYIRRLGGEPVVMSLIGVKGQEMSSIKAVLTSPGKRWLVFTSRNGVRFFFEQMKKEQVDIRSLGDSRIAVMGAGTRKELENWGCYADLVPEQSCSESLAKALCAHAEPDEAICLFRAEEASDVLTKRLREKQYRVVDIPTYRTEIMWKKRELLREMLEDVDAVTFCSASAVSAFVQMTERHDLVAKTICIGPVTAQAAKKAGLHIDKVAEQYDLEGLTEALCAILAQ
ncbi:uroporphyrinogen-III C-methyltransferase [Coprococcus sp. B2-R-112]|uniref:uroporphyrinogen-III C-methyltransferase n=1 Tax=Coprococcus sp. B2-R-112 TaxID=2949662 RepID=UPI00202E23CC|nr:uroporphyrinogen-III C-methyltransferase [Coprococcus sp. B2-R-112]MCM0662475.1 uroporphyrinogen-III C-methyltransferase [Coprococcus sp. B2-R-112]